MLFQVRRFVPVSILILYFTIKVAENLTHLKVLRRVLQLFRACCWINFFLWRLLTFALFLLDRFIAGYFDFVLEFMFVSAIILP